MEAAEESQLMASRRMAKKASLARVALPVALPLAAGLALRLWMLKSLFQVNGDTLIYGDLAKNLLHGRFSLTLPGGAVYPTLIRLPGYPLFLAGCFRVFGIENYFAAACVQVALELLGCLLLADFVRRIVPAPASRGAALATLWLAALCPFTASYTATPLTEAPTLFALALALWSMARFRERPGWAYALWFTFAVTWAAFLRPDGALAAVAFAPVMLIALRRAHVSGHDFTRADSSNKPERALASAAVSGHDFSRAESANKPQRASAPAARRNPTMGARMTAVCMLLALAPFAAWTARNWRVFHVFQPLAPRLANDPDERPNLGFERWVKTWCLDFVSTYDVYWNVPGDKLNLSDLPSRAFDSTAQYAQTAALAADYNRQGMEITPDFDKRFEQLARERIAAHPVRYYMGLPVGRVADMWLRPRVENLNIDLDWWVYAKHHKDTEFAWTYVALNALYLLLGIAGLCLRPRFWGALVAYMLLRSALLLTVAAPEARYTLECLPMLFAAGGIALSRAMARAHLLKEKAPLGTP
jgi:hypothetical protein